MLTTKISTIDYSDQILLRSVFDQKTIEESMAADHFRDATDRSKSRIDVDARNRYYH